MEWSRVCAGGWGPCSPLNLQYLVSGLLCLSKCPVGAPCSGLAFLAKVVLGQVPGFPVPQSPVWVGGMRSRT